MVDRTAALRARAEAAGQGHVFRYWDELDGPGREALLDELAEVDFDLMARLADSLEGEAAAPSGSIEPPELFPLSRSSSDDAERARQRGHALFAEGAVGYVLVAGGQASRLGYDGPKGAFPVGPVSGRSLFEMHARRLLAARERYGRRTPWYVMTSRANDAATREFFERHGHFGLEPEDVVFFSQAMMPAVDLEGRLLLRGPGHLFLAPNGHGGVLAGLESSGALADARARGVRHLSYFQVDNPLARPADPLFLGLHAGAEAGMSSKVVAKRDAGEKVGVLGRVDGRMGCIEYSDLPDELREARDGSGDLRFRAGNIAIHLLDLDFLADLCRGGLDLPWHVARKEMEVWVDGAPARRKGAKFETFVFDALARSDASVTLEVDRRLEFSPVKNAAGEDSPESARRDLCRLWCAWAAAAGRPVPQPGDDGVPAVEVDPRLAEDESTFVERAPEAPRDVAGGHLWE